jgi:hypothetical protein
MYENLIKRVAVMAPETVRRFASSHVQLGYPSIQPVWLYDVVAHFLRTRVYCAESGLLLLGTSALIGFQFSFLPFTPVALSLGRTGEQSD